MKFNSSISSIARSTVGRQRWLVIGLVLRPHERVGCVAKLFARGFSVELPVDCDANAVDPAIPRATLAAERR